MGKGRGERGADGTERRLEEMREEVEVCQPGGTRGMRGMLLSGAKRVHSGLGERWATS